MQRKTTRVHRQIRRHVGRWPTSRRSGHHARRFQLAGSNSGAQIPSALRSEIWPSRAADVIAEAEALSLTDLSCFIRLAEMPHDVAMRSIESFGSGPPDRGSAGDGWNGVAVDEIGDQAGDRDRPVVVQVRRHHLHTDR